MLEQKPSYGYIRQLYVTAHNEMRSIRVLIGVDVFCHDVTHNYVVMLFTEFPIIYFSCMDYYRIYPIYSDSIYFGYAISLDPDESTHLHSLIRIYTGLYLISHASSKQLRLFSTKKVPK